MTKTIHVNFEKQEALKAYCEDHELPMGEVVGALIDYIVKNDVHPIKYMNTDDQDLFTMQDRIISAIVSEGQKTRNTYVSFQRTFEKKYEKDINIIKENIFFNTRKIIAGITKGQQYEKVMNETIQFLSLLVVEELITEYVVTPETALQILEEYSKRLFDRRELYMREIEKMSKLIAISVGTLVDNDKGHIKMTTKRREKKFK